MNPPSATPRPAGLPEHAAPFFTYTMELMASRDPGTLADVRGKAESLLDEFDEKNRKVRIDPEAAKLAGLAMAAALDEIVLTSSWDLRDDWMVRPVAFERFDDLNAGESFYQKLEDLRRRARPGTDELGAMEIYATALALGFRGDLAGSGGEARAHTLLQGLIRQIQEGRGGSSQLAPHAIAARGVSAQFRSVPMWMIGSGMLLVVVLYSLVLHWLAHSSWNDVASQLSSAR